MLPTTLKPTHSDRLVRYLGQQEVDRLTHEMRDFYAPIAVAGVPGEVYAMPGGDFVGKIKGGQECSAMDWADRAIRDHHNQRRATLARHKIGQSRGHLRAQMDREHHAFASLSALITARTGAKGQDLIFAKTGGASNAIGNSNDLFYRAGHPVAGAAGGAAPGGTVPTNATTGNFNYKNPSTANTGHFVTGYATASLANTLLLVDRLFSVAKTMASTATQAVTGVPTRYQNTVTTAADYIGGNFMYPANPTTVLAATAHNWTVTQYTDDAATATQSAPSIAGVSACVVGGIDLAVGAPSWFMPLAAGDTGVKALSQMQCSASVATGTIDFVIAHPIAWFPCPIANMMCIIDGIGSAFNLQYIFDNACLSMIEVAKPATTATNYSGQITTIAE